jgi:hypothetical protein
MVGGVLRGANEQPARANTALAVRANVEHASFMIGFP